MIKFTMGASDNKKTQRRKPKRPVKSTTIAGGTCPPTLTSLSNGGGGFSGFLHGSPLLLDMPGRSVVSSPVCCATVASNGLITLGNSNGMSTMMTPPRVESSCDLCHQYEDAEDADEEEDETKKEEESNPHLRLIDSPMGVACNHPKPHVSVPWGDWSTKRSDHRVGLGIGRGRSVNSWRIGIDGSTCLGLDRCLFCHCQRTENSRPIGDSPALMSEKNADTSTAGGDRVSAGGIIGRPTPLTVWVCRDCQQSVTGETNNKHQTAPKPTSSSSSLSAQSSSTARNVPGQSHGETKEPVISSSSASSPKKTSVELSEYLMSLKPSSDCIVSDMQSDDVRCDTQCYGEDSVHTISNLRTAEGEGDRDREREGIPSDPGVGMMGGEGVEGEGEGTVAHAAVICNCEACSERRLIESEQAREVMSIELYSRDLHNAVLSVLYDISVWNDTGGTRTMGGMRCIEGGCRGGDECSTEGTKKEELATAPEGDKGERSRDSIEGEEEGQRVEEEEVMGEETVVEEGGKEEGKKEVERRRELVHRLCAFDAHELYQTVEQLLHQFFTERRAHFIQRLSGRYAYRDVVSSNDSNVSFVVQDSLHAIGRGDLVISNRDEVVWFAAALLREFDVTCQVFANLYTFLEPLEADHMKPQFEMSLELLHRHLFHSIIYLSVQEQLIVVQSQLRLLVDKEDEEERCRVGSKSQGGGGVKQGENEAGSVPNSPQSLLTSHLRGLSELENIMNIASSDWRDSYELLRRYEEELCAARAHQTALQEDWVQFKTQRDQQRSGGGEGGEGVEEEEMRKMMTIMTTDGGPKSRLMQEMLDAMCRLLRERSVQTFRDEHNIIDLPPPELINLDSPQRCSCAECAGLSAETLSARNAYVTSELLTNGYAMANLLANHDETGYVEPPILYGGGGDCLGTNYSHWCVSGSGHGDCIRGDERVDNLRGVERPERSAVMSVCVPYYDQHFRYVDGESLCEEFEDAEEDEDEQRRLNQSNSQSQWSPTSQSQCSPASQSRGPVASQSGGRNNEALSESRVSIVERRELSGWLERKMEEEGIVGQGKREEKREMEDGSNQTENKTLTDKEAHGQIDEHTSRNTDEQASSKDTIEQTDKQAAEESQNKCEEVDKHADERKDSKADKQTDTQPDRQTDMLDDRHTDTQDDKHTDTQDDKHINTEEDKGKADEAIVKCQHSTEPKSSECKCHFCLKQTTLPFLHKISPSHHPTSLQLTSATHFHPPHNFILPTPHQHSLLLPSLQHHNSSLTSTRLYSFSPPFPHNHTAFALKHPWLPPTPHQHSLILPPHGNFIHTPKPIPQGQHLEHPIVQYPRIVNHHTTTITPGSHLGGQGNIVIDVARPFQTIQSSFGHSLTTNNSLQSVDTVRPGCSVEGVGHGSSVEGVQRGTGFTLINTAQTNSDSRPLFQNVIFQPSIKDTDKIKYDRTNVPGFFKLQPCTFSSAVPQLGEKVAGDDERDQCPSESVNFSPVKVGTNAGGSNNPFSTFNSSPFSAVVVSRAVLTHPSCGSAAHSSNFSAALISEELNCARDPILCGGFTNLRSDCLLAKHHPESLISCRGNTGPGSTSRDIRQIGTADDCDRVENYVTHPESGSLKKCGEFDVERDATSILGSSSHAQNCLHSMQVRTPPSCETRHNTSPCSETSSYIKSPSNGSPITGSPISVSPVTGQSSSGSDCDLPVKKPYSYLINMPPIDGTNVCDIARGFTEANEKTQNAGNRKKIGVVTSAAVAGYQKLSTVYASNQKSCAIHTAGGNQNLCAVHSAKGDQKLCVDNIAKSDQKLCAAHTSAEQHKIHITRNDQNLCLAHTASTAEKLHVKSGATGAQKDLFSSHNESCCANGYCHDDDEEDDDDEYEDDEDCEGEEGDSCSGEEGEGGGGGGGAVKSTKRKEGKFCECWHCEFFGHAPPPTLPTSKNYAEMRDRLRLRLKKKNDQRPVSCSHSQYGGACQTPPRVVVSPTMTQQSTITTTPPPAIQTNARQIANSTTVTKQTANSIAALKPVSNSTASDKPVVSPTAAAKPLANSAAAPKPVANFTSALKPVANSTSVAKQVTNSIISTNQDANSTPAAKTVAGSKPVTNLAASTSASKTSAAAVVTETLNRSRSSFTPQSASSSSRLVITPDLPPPLPPGGTGLSGARSTPSLPPHEDLDELVKFIEGVGSRVGGEGEGGKSSSKAAKRARQKQKKNLNSVENHHDESCDKQVVNNSNSAMSRNIESEGPRSEKGTENKTSVSSSFSSCLKTNKCEVSLTDGRSEKHLEKSYEIFSADGTIDFLRGASPLLKSEIARNKALQDLMVEAAQQHHQRKMQQQQEEQQQQQSQQKKEQEQQQQQKQPQQTVKKNEKQRQQSAAISAAAAAVQQELKEQHEQQLEHKEQLQKFLQNQMQLQIKAQQLQQQQKQQQKQPEKQQLQKQPPQKQIEQPKQQNSNNSKKIVTTSPQSTSVNNTSSSSSATSSDAVTNDGLFTTHPSIARKRIVKNAPNVKVRIVSATMPDMDVAERYFAGIEAEKKAKLERAAAAAAGITLDPHPRIVSYAKELADSMHTIYFDDDGKVIKKTGGMGSTAMANDKQPNTDKAESGVNGKKTGNNNNDDSGSAGLSICVTDGQPRIVKTVSSGGVAVLGGGEEGRNVEIKSTQGKKQTAVKAVPLIAVDVCLTQPIVNGKTAGTSSSKVQEVNRTTNVTSTFTNGNGRNGNAGNAEKGKCVTLPQVAVDSKMQASNAKTNQDQKQTSNGKARQEQRQVATVVKSQASNAEKVVQEGGGTKALRIAACADPHPSQNDRATNVVEDGSVGNNNNNNNKNNTSNSINNNNNNRSTKNGSSANNSGGAKNSSTKNDYGTLSEISKKSIAQSASEQPISTRPATTQLASMQPSSAQKSKDKRAPGVIAADAEKSRIKDSNSAASLGGHICNGGPTQGVAVSKEERGQKAGSKHVNSTAAENVACKNALRNNNFLKDSELADARNSAQSSVIEAHPKMIGQTTQKDDEDVSNRQSPLMEIETGLAALSLECPGSKTKKGKKKGKGKQISVDEIFMPKDPAESQNMDDYVEREIEEFKRFCLHSTPPTGRREKLQVSMNLKDIFTKKK